MQRPSQQSYQQKPPETLITPSLSCQGPEGTTGYAQRPPRRWKRRRLQAASAFGQRGTFFTKEEVIESSQLSGERRADTRIGRQRRLTARPQLLQSERRNILEANLFIVLCIYVPPRLRRPHAPEHALWKRGERASERERCASVQARI